MTDELKNYWISWYHEEKFSPFELHNPWWISGWRVNDDAATIVSAIKATDEIDAQRKIYHSYDEIPEKIEFRFHDEFPKNESPYSERFPQTDWMKWE